MNSGVCWITLSEGASWLAFGRMFKTGELKQYLSSHHYSPEKLEALQDAVEKVTSRARNVDLILQGKLLASADETSETALTECIPAEKLEDYQAFDITSGGLRYGTELMWLPNTQVEGDTQLCHTQQQLLRPEHYADVMLDYVQLEKQCRPRKHKPLAQTELEKWWNGLSDDEKMRGEAAHRRILKFAFPDHDVARQRLRDLRGPRKRGREKKSP